MASSPYNPFRWGQFKGITSDIDPLARQVGIVDDALNIHAITQGGNTTLSVEPVLGNEFAYRLPVIVAQNQIVRFYFNISATVDETIKYDFTDWNATAIGTQATLVTTHNDIATTLTDFIAALATASISATTSSSVTGTLTGYVDVELTTNLLQTWTYVLAYTAPATIDNYYARTGQEAIDASLAGLLHTIGSYDVDGDLMIWSTPQTNLPQEYTITAFSNNAGDIQLTIADTSNIIVNAMIKISGSATSNNANGLWIVKSVDSATTFTIDAPFAANNSPRGTLTINVNGVGQIGVAQKDESVGAWVYTRLLTSREFNFRTKKQIKAVCERNDRQLNCYWTDNYNPYRRFYYQGTYLTNGALNILSPLGLYFYGTIYNETRLFQGNGLAEIQNPSQPQVGGGLYAGNYRYIIRFLDDFFNPTLWTEPSGIFVVSLNPLTPNTLAIAEQVYGNPSTQPTSKINQMDVVGITPNLFRYMELGVLWYVDGTPVPQTFIANRFILDQTTTQTIQHTGNETNVQLLDINTLQQTQPDILTGLNIEIIANRLVPSNTSSYSTTDFSTWVDTFQYNLKQDSITGRGDRFTGTLQVGEYEISENTFGKLGFMLNETYRVSAKFELLNGAFTDNFWFDDIMIDDQNPNVGKRVTPLPNMDLTDNVASLVYIPYIEVINIDWNFQINGIAAKDIVKKIHWEYVEMLPQYQEVLGSGVIAMGSKYALVFGEYVGGIILGTVFSANQGINVNMEEKLYASPTKAAQHLTDYIFACGVDLSASAFPADTDLPYDSANVVSFGIVPDTRFASFYCWDQLLNKSSYSWQNGDALNVFGSPTIWATNSAHVGFSGGSYNAIANDLREFTGYTNTAFTSFPIDESHSVARGGTTGFALPSVTYSHAPYNEIETSYPLPAPPLQDTLAVQMDLPTSPVMYVAGGITTSTGNTDYGVYVAQIFRARTNKFGNIAQSKYIPTGAITSYLSATTNVYGDTFNQKAWLKHYRTDSVLLSSGPNASWAYPGLNQGMAFYGQNRVNSQMQWLSNNGYSNQYPILDESAWLNVNGYTGVHPDSTTTFNYNSGYNIQQGITTDIAFDPLLPRSDREPARFWWSLNKPENSIADLYTVILPLNFRDLDLTHGEISEHRNVNGNLFTWQNRHYEMQYFDNTGLISSSTSDVVFGSSGVATQRGSTLSTYGTKHGFSVITGKSVGGKETTYWINTEDGKVMRYEPSDGTVCISDLQDMRWFFNNKLRFANDAFTPADGQGICGVWDEQHSEAVWTVRAHKQLSTWSSIVTYGIGDEVFYQPSVYSTFEQTGEIYVSKVANNTSLPTVTTAWELISHDNINYYNEYTIAYSEPLKHFSTRYSPLPKIYLKKGKSIVAPRPVENEHFHYEYYRGEYCVWFRDLTATTSLIEQAENWFIDGMIVNVDVNSNKHFMATEWITAIAPERIDITTPQYQTFMLASDVEQRGDFFLCSTKMDILAANPLSPLPLNEQDTDPVQGIYSSWKLSGSPRIYQKFFNFISKGLGLKRDYHS